MSLDDFRVIKGHFHIRGFKPDGDSVRFTALQPTLFHGLYRDYKINSPSGDFQLRLEGIDAPETHYGAEGQPLGDTARDRLLALLGYENVEITDEKVIKCQPDTVPGAILTKGIDPHGRPISYALLGDSLGFVDGHETAVSVALLDKTLNVQLLKDGSAYPLLYTSTPASHRAHLREQGKVARDKKLGVWARDSSREFQLVDHSSICLDSGTLIYPKFFRRSIDYLRQVGSGEFVGDFAAWLGATEKENDRVLVDKLEVSLSTLFEQHNSRVVCQADILDMIFIEK